MSVQQEATIDHQQTSKMNYGECVEWMDEEMEALIDSAIEDANAKAVEEAEKFDVLSQDIEQIVESAEREYKKAKKSKSLPKEAELSVIFVSKDSIEHLKYVQSMREFLKKEARKMVKCILRDREAEKQMREGKQAGKKRARRD